MDRDKITAELETLDGARKKIIVSFPPPPEVRMPIIHRSSIGWQSVDEPPSVVDVRVYEFIGYSDSGITAKYKEK